MPPLRRSRIVDTAIDIDARPAKRVKVKRDGCVLDDLNLSIFKDSNSLDAAYAYDTKKARQSSAREFSQHDPPSNASLRTKDADLRFDLAPSSYASLVEQTITLDSMHPPDTHVRLENDVTVNEEPCQRSDIDVFRGAQDPNEDKTNHILKCERCCNKLSAEIFSQRWFDSGLISAVEIDSNLAVERLISCGANAAFLAPTEIPLTSKQRKKSQHNPALAVPMKWTALHLAILRGRHTSDDQMNVIRALSRIPTSLNRPTFPWVQTALNLACDFGEIPEDDQARTKELERLYSMISILLEAGADANIPAIDGNLPIHTFLKSSASGTTTDFLETLQRLVEKTADLNTANDKGDSALTLAAKHCCSAVELLLAQGACAKFRNKIGMVPLHYASSMQSFKPLLNCWPEGLLSRSSASGLTPLHTAVIRGRQYVVKAIIEYAPEYIHQATEEQQNCLHLTRFCKDDQVALDLIRYLSQKHCDSRQEDIKGRTALHYHLPWNLISEDEKIWLDISSHRIMLTPESMQSRRIELLSKGHCACEPNRHGQTLLGCVFTEIIKLTGRMKRNHKSPADYGDAWDALDSSFTTFDQMHACISCAEDIIKLGGELTSIERSTLLSNRALRTDLFIGPFFRFLEKYAIFGVL